MVAFRKILVPTDGSECAREAVRVAAELAQAFAARMVIVYFFEPFKYALPEGYVIYTPEQMNHMLQEFEAMVSEAATLAREAGAASVETQVLQGVPASGIGEHAEQEGFDLIVMGSHGRTGLGRALMGSIAEKVVRTAHCPVLTVKARERAGQESQE